MIYSSVLCCPVAHESEVTAPFQTCQMSFQQDNAKVNVDVSCISQSALGATISVEEGLDLNEVMQTVETCLDALLVDLLLDGSSYPPSWTAPQMVRAASWGDQSIKSSNVPTPLGTASGASSTTPERPVRLNNEEEEVSYSLVIHHSLGGLSEEKLQKGITELMSKRLHHPQGQDTKPVLPVTFIGVSAAVEVFSVDIMAYVKY
eukprot:Trichotokara_eunicae@DN4500_c0_g1_i2.p1